jgi:hypothetical protein
MNSMLLNLVNNLLLSLVNIVNNLLLSLVNNMLLGIRLLGFVANNKFPLLIFSPYSRFFHR